MDFRFCSPDANTFESEIRFRSLKDIDIRYVKLTEKTGYWVADNLFLDDGFEKYKNLIAAFPIVKNNNVASCTDPNPFDTIHLPEWMTKNIVNIIITFYKENIEEYSVNENIHEWGNLYWKDLSRPIEAFRIPHVDYPHGLVGNLWLSDNPLGSTGTNLYEYTGKIYGLYYDFQVDESHPLYKRYKELSTTNRLPSWKNFNEDEANEFGFIHVGMAPSEYSKMTLYKSGTPHCPFIDESVDFRWSHAFAFEHDIITTRSIFS